MASTSSSRPTKTAAFYAAARDAVVQYARMHAFMPAFQATKPQHQYAPWGFIRVAPRGTQLPPIARVLTCGAVAGDVLPLRADARDTWLTLLPFEDYRFSWPRTSDDGRRRDWLTKRARVVRLLARLAGSRDFAFHTGIDCCASDTSEALPAKSFWLLLLQALAPDADGDTTKELERNLAALRCGGALRILVSVETNLAHEGVADSFEWFFKALAEVEPNETDDDDKEFRSVLETCGLTGLPPSHVIAPSVELGFEFLTGKVSPAVMAVILDGLENLRPSPMFRASCLRFGPDCPFTTKAIELLEERLPSLALDTLELGRTRDIRPLRMQRTLTTVAASVRRLVTSDRDGSIASVTSTLRSGRAIAMEALDLTCCADRDLAEWLALTVFHVDSPSRVSSLCLRMPIGNGWLSRDWIEHFKDVLQRTCVAGDTNTSHPDNDADPNRPRRVRQFVTLATNTMVRFSPYEGRKITTKLSEADVEFEFERLVDHADDATQVAVLVPGVGTGWVPHAAIVHSRTEPSQLDSAAAAAASLSKPRTNGRVTSFTWSRPTGSTHAAHGDALVDLLSIIGEPLERLALPGMALSNIHVAQILRHCPNLTALNLSDNPLCDLTPIMEAMTSGLCTKLTSLSLLRPNSPFSGAVISPATQSWLACRPSAPTARLERLAVHVTAPFSIGADRAAFDRDHVLPLVAALQLNNMADYIELRVPAHSARALFVANAAVVTDERSVTLPMRCKLALLSVLQRPTPRDDAMGQLDAAVLGLIFQFSRRKRIMLITSSGM